MEKDTIYKALWYELVQNFIALKNYFELQIYLNILPGKGNGQFSFFLSDYISINVSPNAPHSAKILSAKTCILSTNVTYFRRRKAQNLENKDKGISVEVFCGVFCYGYAVGKVSWAMLFENPAEVEKNHAQLSMKSKTRADDISFNRRHLIKPEVYASGELLMTIKISENYFTDLKVQSVHRALALLRKWSSPIPNKNSPECPQSYPLHYFRIQRVTTRIISSLTRKMRR